MNRSREYIIITIIIPDIVEVKRRSLPFLSIPTKKSTGNEATGNYCGRELLENVNNFVKNTMTSLRMAKLTRLKRN